MADFFFFFALHHDLIYLTEFVDPDPHEQVHRPPSMQLMQLICDYSGGFSEARSTPELDDPAFPCIRIRNSAGLKPYSDSTIEGILTFDRHWMNFFLIIARAVGVVVLNYCTPAIFFRILETHAKRLKYQINP